MKSNKSQPHTLTSSEIFRDLSWHTQIPHTQIPKHPLRICYRWGSLAVQETSPNWAMALDIPTRLCWGIMPVVILTSADIDVAAGGPQLGATRLERQSGLRGRGAWEAKVTAQRCNWPVFNYVWLYVTICITKSYQIPPYEINTHFVRYIDQRNNDRNDRNTHEQNLIHWFIKSSYIGDLMDSQGLLAYWLFLDLLASWMQDPRSGDSFNTVLKDAWNLRHRRECHQTCSFFC